MLPSYTPSVTYAVPQTTAITTLLASNIGVVYTVLGAGFQLLICPFADTLIARNLARSCRGSILTATIDTPLGRPVLLGSDATFSHVGRSG